MLFWSYWLICCHWGPTSFCWCFLRGNKGFLRAWLPGVSQLMGVCWGPSLGASGLSWCLWVREDGLRLQGQETSSDWAAIVAECLHWYQVPLAWDSVLVERRRLFLTAYCSWTSQSMPLRLLLISPDVVRGRLISSGESPSVVRSGVGTWWPV